MGFARMAVSVDYDRLPVAVRNKAKVHVLDTIGLAFASLSQPFAAPSLAGIVAAGGQGRCRVLGTPYQLTARDAAMANGLLMHGLDFDDTHLASIIHASVASLPVALSLGEYLDISWNKMLAAYVLGMEVAIRIGASVKGGFHATGFHATGVVSHFSSAVVAGKLLGLNIEQICAVQGVAASTASGVQVFLEEGAWTKRMHPGWGALAGITAAYMTQAGFVAPSRPYEGKFGLYDTHLDGAEVDEALIRADLGTHWRMLETAIKPYPICHFSHACAEAAAILSPTVLGRLDDIDEIVAYLPQPTLHIVAEPAEKKQRVLTDYDAKFSVQYVVAASLLRGGFGMNELSPESIANPQFTRLATQIICKAEENTEFPKYFSGQVTVKFKNGEMVSEHIPINKGAGAREMTWDHVAEKFLGNVGMVASEQKAAAMLDAINHAEGKSVRDVLSALTL
ncbi:MmgE/PrpD family protein [Alcaligenaceae bacterium CGII-47]|nr:MmgE/PrpD family protein [Alcaligenaceae bacterium CGII-47]